MFGVMKSMTLLLTVATLLFAGCRFKSPLVKEHTIPIDPAVIGLWEPLRKEGKGAEGKPEKDMRMLILGFSETEYMVRQPMGDGAIHYRAYPVELGGIRCVQLKAIGDDKGPLGGDKSLTTPYQVVSYETEDAVLVIRTLNDKLFPGSLETTEALQEAFLKNKDKEDLFTNPERYRKIPAQ